MSDIPFQYQTIKTKSTGIYKDRGSKFYAYLLPAQSTTEIAEELDSIATIHPKARHLCYAYRLGINGEPHRINDDGEPSGTAGRPIFNVLLSSNISDVLAIVVRYFGGTKLGVPGLIKAYKEATLDALQQSVIITKTLTQEIIINYRIEDLGRIFDILKNRGVSDIQTEYGQHPQIVCTIPLNDVPFIRQMILADYYGYQVDDIVEDFVSDRLEIIINKDE